MTIASAIQSAQQKVANAYTAISNKGGTLPATQDLANMPNAISSISSVNNDTLTVTPTTSQQTFNISGGHTGYNPVTVDAVTSAIDSNITAGNIKSGVSILGVSGSVVALAGETRTVSIISTSGNTFTPSSGKNGITSIKVTPTNQNRTVTPTTSQQTLSVNSGYSGNGTITVNAVTSNIDANITAGNIKKDVTILGVTGTFEGGGGGGEYDYRNLIGNFYILTDGSITPIRFMNVRMGNSTIFNCELNTLMTSMGSTGDIYTTSGADYSAIATAYLSNAEWTGFPSSIKHISFKAITGEFDIRNNVYSGMTSLKSVDFSNATKLKLQSTFTRCTNLESVDLSSLSDLTSTLALGGSVANGGAFAYTALTTLSFPALTSTSFGRYTNQFNNMLKGVTGCTVHFPSNLQSVIGSWSSVTSGFFGTNTTVLFDLPATT